jgi:pimeloyl-ACP methyl ester carboxylesterase
LDRFGRDGLTFEVTDAGSEGDPVVILLHGFPEDRSSWTGVIPALTGAGFRVLAPDLRGYSPAARPRARRAYALGESAADVLALADAAGARQVHVVGHDWGAALAWYLAARHPDRVRTVAALSVPHTEAFLRAMVRGSQLPHSWYMLFFQIPWLPERLLALGRGRAMERILVRRGLPAEDASRYARKARDRAALTGAVNWYRGIPFGLGSRLGAVRVPTLFVWSDGDVAITRAAAEACGRYVTGPYRYQVLEGRSHWLPEEDPAAVSGLLLEHIGAHGNP